MISCHYQREIILSCKVVNLSYNRAIIMGHPVDTPYKNSEFLSKKHSTMNVENIVEVPIWSFFGDFRG